LIGDLGFETILEDPEAPEEDAPGPGRIASVPKKIAPQSRKARRGVAVAKARRTKSIN
jgi:hypothetical protein